MTLILKTKKSKFGTHEQLQVIVKGAVNVPMNEVAFDNSGGNKTFITDALATCAAIALYGNNIGFPTAFTHMSSESTPSDDQRKERVLDQMLEYILKTNSLAEIKLVISPPSIEEHYLINFIEQWAKNKKISYKKLSTGGDSAVFHRDETGKALMLTTSLTLKEMDKMKKTDKRWYGKGIVIATSCNQLEDDYNSSDRSTGGVFNRTTFFSYSKAFKSDSFINPENRRNRTPSE